MGTDEDDWIHEDIEAERKAKAEEKAMTTAWAPPQHKGMKCCCHDSDPERCVRSRYSIDSRRKLDGSEWCDCICHDQDWCEDDE